MNKLDPELSPWQDLALIAASTTFYSFAFTVGVELWQLAAYLMVCGILVGKNGWLVSLRSLTYGKSWLLGLGIPSVVMIPAGILLSGGDKQDSQLTMVSILLLILLACGEEFAVRLSLTRTLGNRFGIAFGIGISALIFGLLHYPGSGSWMAVALTTAGGVIYGISYFYGKSIVVPIVLHVLNNLCMELI